jgi:hypothetical protein
MPELTKIFWYSNAACNTTPPKPKWIPIKRERFLALFPPNRRSAMKKPLARYRRMAGIAKTGVLIGVDNRIFGDELKRMIWDSAGFYAGYPLVVGLLSASLI